MTVRTDSVSIAGYTPAEWMGTPPTPGPKGAMLWKLQTGHMTASRAAAVVLAYTAQGLVSSSLHRTVVLPGGFVIDSARILKAVAFEGPKARAGGGFVRIRWEIALPDTWAADVLAAGVFA